MNYRLAYRLGFHPWEDLAEHPPFADALLRLVAREEDGDGPPYGAGARPRLRQRGVGRPARAPRLAGDGRRPRRAGAASAPATGSRPPASTCGSSTAT